MIIDIIRSKRLYIFPFGDTILIDAIFIEGCTNNNIHNNFCDITMTQNRYRGKQFWIPERLFHEVRICIKNSKIIFDWPGFLPVRKKLWGTDQCLGIFQTVTYNNQHVLSQIYSMGFTRLSWIKVMDDSGGDVDAVVEEIFQSQFKNFNCEYVSDLQSIEYNRSSERIMVVYIFSGSDATVLIWQRSKRLGNRNLTSDVGNDRKSIYWYWKCLK